MSWLTNWLPASIRSHATPKKGVPEGLWTKCKQCDAILYRQEWARLFFVCPHCEHHERINANDRLASFLDSTDYEALSVEIAPQDYLKFKDSKKYKDRITQAQKLTGLNEALLTVKGQLKQKPVIVAVFDFEFMGGSMSFGVGEKYVQAINHALACQVPFITFSSSGGARMQEGLISLFQMSKTSAALAKLSEAGLPFISVLTDPTMGGVSASLAMLGDLIFAEPNALIGFAGPRVIQQTVRQVLPEGFQRSEFLLAHGHIDGIIPRAALRDQIAAALACLMHDAI